jgi:pyruvate/2-oxoglutarate dehydrogenase complex dihydrolipoamide dehydrogenase (E3) component
MTDTTHYDAIVVGAGQSGGPLSTALARAGRRTALIEREHVGGTCINEGCTPTKTMVASGRVAYLARRAADYGVITGPVSVDMQKVRQRKRDVVTSFRSGSERRITSTPGVDLIRGEARFAGVRVLQVDGRALSAEQVFLNVGARPSNPPIPGLDQIDALNSTSIMELDRVPDHLLVLGGGYVGLEFGQMFRRFGSRVTVVQRGPRLLSREDADVADAVADLLREDGVEVLLDTSTVRAEPGPKLVVRSRDSAERTLSGSHLLVCVGRTPNTGSLNAGATGLEVDDHGFIRANDRLETNVPGVYALGDAKGGPAFTHISYDDFRVLRTNLIEGGSASIRDRLVPYTVYIDPQLGRVGMSEEEARVSGRQVRVAKMPMSHVARALETDESRGFMKAIVDAESGQILGAAVLGVEGGELMSMLEIAMLGKLPYPALRDAIFAHPTLAEAFNNLFTSGLRDS